MPRVAINRKKYIQSDFTKWLVGEIYGLGMKRYEFAEAIGMSGQLLSYKIKNNSFCMEDLICIFQYLGTEREEIGRLLGGKK